MLCVYAFTKGVMNIIEERKDKKRSRKERADFFFDSLSDETYLDLIRSQIEFLIDEGYKYSEQLEIINRESGRSIKYDAYTKFVKLFILEKPENLFQSREFNRHYRGHNSRAKNEDQDLEEDVVPKKRIHREERVSSFESNNSQPIIKRQIENPEPVKAVNQTQIKREPIPQAVSRPNRVVFQHQAMPDVSELY